ncbi:DUF1727 domain-containing protein [Candidatus Saccharibacteria bacterium]|nr:DUF1727 domain-containing protein [Candidatus Saccharibacteria bacterium]
MEGISILLGKGIQKVTHLRGGGGSALPGLVVERINPKFIKKILSKLPLGVVVISGTNGKTTTTKIVSELLEKQGLRVFTNNTGSNFVRGVISAILQDIKLNGDFNYDIAVLELDEAHAVKFTEVAPVDYALLLNVQRDQLDRFGEIDHTANLLQKVATATKKTVVLNREDPRVGKITANHVDYFGLSDALIKKFPSDDDLIKSTKTKSSDQNASVIFKQLKGNRATYTVGKKDYTVDLKLKGMYNAYNVAGALALCHAVMPEVKTQKFIDELKTIESAFGRGESFTINGKEVELLLVKNPSAFQLSIASFADDDYDFMIAINDKIADGRDISWLWNVDFAQLDQDIKLVAGIRAYDMALRLKYDNIQVDTIIENLEEAVRAFVTDGDKPKRIFATYTAMLEIRKIISGKSIL